MLTENRYYNPSKNRNSGATNHMYSTVQHSVHIVSKVLFLFFISLIFFEIICITIKEKIFLSLVETRTFQELYV